MNLLVTGARGFIGRNLIEALEKNKDLEILRYDKETDPQALQYLTRVCDFVYHFAAVHRPADESEFEKVNHILFADLLAMLRSNSNSCPVLLTSSIQTDRHSTYGKSKLAAEKELREHAERTNSRAVIYRLTNTFGRYAKPNNHSVVATFCYNIARGLPITISDPDRVLKLYYIDDVIASFIAHIHKYVEPDSDGFHRLPQDLEHKITLNELACRIYSLKACIDREQDIVINDQFNQKLYETYLSYIP